MTAQPQPAKPNSAEIYQSHMVPALFAPWAPELIARATPRPGDRVLDVATGTGAVARQVAPLVGSSGSVTGLDPNGAMLQVARELPAPEGAAIEWVAGDGLALPFPDAAFDLVLCQQGLQFFPDRPLGLREMRRVLAPGGRVGVMVWQAIERQLVIHAFDEVLSHHVADVRMLVPFSLGDSDELHRLLDEAGFSATTIEPVTREVRFPSRATYVRLSIMGAAAVVPGFMEMGEEALEALISAVQADMEERLRPYVDDEAIAFPMSANVATARA